MKKKFIGALIFAVSLVLVVGTALAYTGTYTLSTIAYMVYLDTQHSYLPDTNGRINVSYNLKTYYNMSDTEPVTDTPQNPKVAARSGGTTVTIMSLGTGVSWNSSKTLQGLNTSTYYGIRFSNTTQTRYIKGSGVVSANGQS